MLASDAPVIDNPNDEVLETYKNPDGITCRIVRSGTSTRIDRWYDGRGKDREAKWLPWLQSGEANEILEHRKAQKALQAEKDSIVAERDSLKQAHDLLFVENQALKNENAQLKAKKP